jgi:hypothetical protein
MIRRLVYAFAALFVLLGARQSLAIAQTSNEYQIAVAIDSINQPVFQPEVPNLGVALKSLTAKVDGASCSTEALAGATNDVVLHIGLSDQPAACSVEGAKVTLVDGNGHTLATSFTLQKGSRDTLINLAPQPPHDPGDGGPLDGPVSNEFQVLLPTASLNLRSPVDPAPERPVTLGNRIGVLTALADGVACTSVDVSNLPDDYVLRLGLPDQPPACAKEDATVTFTNSRGQTLIGSMTLHLGARETLRNFSPPVVPPAVNDAPPDPTSTPQAPRSSSVTPPDTGSGGLLQP